MHRAALPSRNFGPPVSLRGPDTSGVESDTTLYWLMFAVGLVPVVVALLRGQGWGVQPTVGALFCVLAARALLTAYVLRVRDRRTAYTRPNQT